MKNPRVLTYHSISDSNCKEVGADLYRVSAEQFRRQIEHIAKNSCPLTFDDGLLDNYLNAYPVLKEFGLKAYFFILVGRVGTDQYMSWEQIKELRDNGMIIGSHGMTHRILTDLSRAELDYELNESKKILESRLGGAVDYFSLPRGFCNKQIIEMAKTSGYKKVFVSKPSGSNGFQIGRTSVKSDWDLAYFIKVADTGLSLPDRAKERTKDLFKKMLGSGTYDRIRTTILKNK